VSHRIRWRFPVGILVVNLSGALVLGVVVGLTLDHQASMIVGTGLIGSFTTFSTWMRQTQGLLVDRRPVAATANLAVSLLLGVAAAWSGLWIGGQL
jgi:CrcB protein